MADANEFFSEYRARILRYLSRFVRNRETARDLTQDVFLRVTRGPIPSTTKRGERAWIFRIAKNLALNHLRHARLGASVGLRNGTAAATQELSLALREALANLSKSDRQAFLLREIRGLDYSEIAGKCNVSPIAVRSRVHRARRQLRKALGKTPRPDVDGMVRL